MLKNYLKETAQEFVKKGEDFTAYEVSRAMNDRLISEGEDPIRHLLIRDIVHETLDEFINNGELDRMNGMHKGHRCQVYSPVAAQLMNHAMKTCGLQRDKSGSITTLGPSWPATKTSVKVDSGAMVRSDREKTVIVNRTKYGVNIPAALCRYAGIHSRLTVVVNGNCVQSYAQRQLKQNRSYTVDKHNEVRLTNAALNDMKIQSTKVKLTASRTGCIKVEEV